MDIENFFQKVNENNWRSNIKNEASHKFDITIQHLIENKESIIDYIYTSVKDMESLKLEDNEEFTYTTFHKWLNYYLRESIEETMKEDE